MSSKGSLLEGCVTTVCLPVNTVCMEVWIKQDTDPQCPQCIQNTGTRNLLECVLHNCYNVPTGVSEDDPTYSIIGDRFF